MILHDGFKPKPYSLTPSRLVSFSMLSLHTEKPSAKKGGGTATCCQEPMPETSFPSTKAKKRLLDSLSLGCSMLRT
ncbi:unnamed protein product [Arabidopsis lyrata]|uniref:Predicted protein n=1 Tax=Arabidopsis lyrata subsp. lyrata TaxID=81972 RepID=D7L0Z5_ARALL|nr:predicted protein [Arabidopsis lyrata subsp. lyrata]CAH8262176.1 unnamed protein product [Arabidopsis lyrata]